MLTYQYSKFYVCLFMIFMLFGCSENDNSETPKPEPGPNPNNGIVEIIIPGSTDNKEVLFDFISSTKSVVIKTDENVAWSIPYLTALWCKIHDSGGKGNGEILITAEDNLSFEDRTVTVLVNIVDAKTFHPIGNVGTIKITQKKRSAIFKEIHVDEPGTLESLINAYDDSEFITDLKITGDIIYDDVMCLKTFKYLENIDMKSASIIRYEKYNNHGEKIVYGGGYIYENAFSIMRQLKSIILPDNISSISENAFYFCDNLKSIEIPNGVTHIGRTAFRNCHNLEHVKFPDSLTTIGEGAFYRCKALKEFKIPPKVRTIDSYAFYECEALEKIDLNNNELGGVGVSVFKGCVSLKEIHIITTNGFFNISSSAFLDCTSLTSFTLESKYDGELQSSGRPYYEIRYKSFAGCSNLKKVSLLISKNFNRKASTFSCNSSFGGCPIEEFYVNDYYPLYLEDDHLIDKRYVDQCTLYIRKQTLNEYKEKKIWNAILSSFKKVVEFY